eukprot:1542632-Pleurochrysis_carterae.AAC.1
MACAVTCAGACAPHALGAESSSSWPPKDPCGTTKVTIRPPCSIDRLWPATAPAGSVSRIVSSGASPVAPNLVECAAPLCSAAAAACCTPCSAACTARIAA